MTVSYKEVKFAPDKIVLEWEWHFPDEPARQEGAVSTIGYICGDKNRCVSGNPEEVFTNYYVDEAMNYISQLAGRVEEAYACGMIPEGVSCREYFLKYKLPHIELVDFE